MTGDAGATVARWRLTITGTVQGVGFRPHVHRQAVARGVGGFVGNDSAGVFIEAQADPATLAQFRRAVVQQAPPLARILTVDTAPMPPLATEGAGSAPLGPTGACRCSGRTGLRDRPQPQRHRSGHLRAAGHRRLP